MSKLEQYAKNPRLARMKLTYKGETIKFNTWDELYITNLNKQIKSNPALYSFVKRIHSVLIFNYEKKDAFLEKIYSRLFIMYKSKTNTEYYETNQKVPSDKVAEEMVKGHKKYVSAKAAMILAKQKMTDMGAVVRGFEQKKDMLQSISANTRKEI